MSSMLYTIFKFIFTHLYVIKANASPTRLMLLPRTTPNATIPPCAAHVFPPDTFVDGGKPWICPVYKVSI